MRKLFVCLTVVLLANFAGAQATYFPPLTGNSWETLAPETLGWQIDKIDSLYALLQEKNSKAFVLLKNGKIVMEKYFGTFTQDSLFYWASAGKTLTAFTIGITKQEGLLSLDDRSSKYLDAGWTSCARAKEDLITIRHQLTMTTGLDDAVADPYCTHDTCLEYLADAGSRWAYHNAPYTLLDNVVEKASGQTFNQYFRAKISSKIGMNGAFFKVDYNNIYISTARSMARFGLLVLNNGVWDKTVLMSDTGYFHQMVTPSQTLNNSYGYLWWLNGKASFMVPTLQTVFPGPFAPDAPSDMIAALGKNGQIINVVPSGRLVWVRMGDAPGSGEVPYTLDNQIWQKLKAIIGTSGVSSSHNVPADRGTAAVRVQNGILRICLPGKKSGPVLIRIFNACGRMIVEKHVDTQVSIHLPVDTFGRGMFVYSVILKHTRESGRFFVSP